MDDKSQHITYIKALVSDLKDKLDAGTLDSISLTTSLDEIDASAGSLIEEDVNEK